MWGFKALVFLRHPALADFHVPARFSAHLTKPVPRVADEVTSCGTGTLDRTTDDQFRARVAISASTQPAQVVLQETSTRSLALLAKFTVSGWLNRALTQIPETIEIAGCWLENMKLQSGSAAFVKGSMWGSASRALGVEFGAYGSGFRVSVVTYL